MGNAAIAALLLSHQEDPELQELARSHKSMSPVILLFTVIAVPFTIALWFVKEPEE